MKERDERDFVVTDNWEEGYFFFAFRVQYTTPSGDDKELLVLAEGWHQAYEVAYSYLNWDKQDSGDRQCFINEISQILSPVVYHEDLFNKGSG